MLELKSWFEVVNNKNNNNHDLPNYFSWLTAACNRWKLNLILPKNIPLAWNITRDDKYKEVTAYNIAMPSKPHEVVYNLLSPKTPPTNIKNKLKPHLLGFRAYWYLLCKILMSCKKQQRFL